MIFFSAFLNMVSIRRSCLVLYIVLVCVFVYTELCTKSKIGLVTMIHTYNPRTLKTESAGLSNSIIVSIETWKLL